jgi:HEAT repeat protein
MSELSAPHEAPLAKWLGRLAHPDRLERVHAAAELVRLGRANPAVAAALSGALRDERVVVRKMTALVLGDLAADAGNVVPALAAALADPDEGVRRRAAVALGQFRGEALAAVAALRSALRDPDDGVRSFAASSLALIDPSGRHTDEAA